MRAKELVSILFTEHPRTGYSAAILTIAFCAAMIVGAWYGAATLGQAIFADTPAVETTQS
jgi:hypothetical protein